MWTLKECCMTISSSPVSSRCVYKLFSSSRVWSRTWCMPRFSSLACDNFSGEKTKRDTVKSRKNKKIIKNNTARGRHVLLHTFVKQHSAVLLSRCFACDCFGYFVHHAKNSTTPLCPSKHERWLLSSLWRLLVDYSVDFLEGMCAPLSGHSLCKVCSYLYLWTRVSI